MLTVYWNLASQPARAVKALVDIGQLDAQFVYIDILKGQTHTPEYLGKNHFGKVPFITHGDYGLAESNAILVYLCQTFPQKLSQYYGKTPQERGVVNQYLSWYQSSFRPGLLRIISLKFGKVKKQKLLAFQLEQADAQIKRTLDSLEQILTNNKTTFIAGNHLTIADLLLFHELTNLLVYEQPFDSYTAITAWFHKVLEVKEVRAIHDEYEKILPHLHQFIKNIQADDV